MQYKSPKEYPNQIVIKESKYWNIILWDNQYYLGRAIIQYKDFSKRHLSELDRNEILELFSLIEKYELVLKKTFDTTNFNWTCMMNNQYKEKNRDNPEKLHLHVWPRYKETIKFEGMVFQDEVFAHHYDKFKEKYLDKDFLIKLANELLKNWED